MTDNLFRGLRAIVTRLDVQDDVDRELIKIALDWNGFPRRYRVLYLAQRGLCGVCREFMPPTIMHGAKNHSTPSRDHVVPRAHGGRGFGSGNILLSHRCCNNDRGDASATAEMLEFRREVYLRLDLYRSIVMRAATRQPGPEETVTKQYSYDPACEDLARHFLGDLARRGLSRDLAQHIQDEVEAWLRREIEARGGATPTEGA